MNITTLAAPVAVLTLAIGGVISAQEAKTERSATNRIGASTATSGSNGASVNTNNAGGSSESNRRREVRDRDSKTCTTGSAPFCHRLNRWESLAPRTTSTPIKPDQVRVVARQSMRSMMADQCDCDSDRI